MVLGVTVVVWAAYHRSPAAEIGGRYRALDAFGMCLVGLQTVPLAWRRARPVSALAVMTAAALIFYAFNYLPVNQGVGPIFALYSVAAHCDRKKSLASLAATIVAGFGLRVGTGPPGRFLTLAAGPHPVRGRASSKRTTAESVLIPTTRAV
jgi:hypothetical protein